MGGGGKGTVNGQKWVWFDFGNVRVGRYAPPPKKGGDVHIHANSPKINAH